MLNMGRRNSGDTTPTVGMVLAFTGHYRSVRIMADFLRRVGVNLVTSKNTSPSLLETASTVASADFCLPLRTYVGHVHRLITEHPELDFIVAPNVLAEDGLTSTCSKYRDIGGVVIRSLGDTLGYHLKFAPDAWRGRLARLVGEDAVEGALGRSRRLPRIVQPMIESADEGPLFNVCFDVYREIFGRSRFSKLALAFPGLGARIGPWVGAVERAFHAAYAAHDPDRPTRYYEELWKHPDRPRLALVGRRYLLHDDTLSADLRRYFLRRGVNVITATDVPFSELRPHYEQVDGFYDTHREGEALIEWALPHVDGFISIGSFGCHPDAFQVETLAAHARRTGKPVWTFRYDETVGNAGFTTRYETILTFLQQERDRRVSDQGPVCSASPGIPASTSAERPGTGRRLSGRPRQTTAFTPADGSSNAVQNNRRALKPLIIWPTMGEVLDLLIQELAHQAGWDDYIHVPPPMSEETIRQGNTHFTESCSPFALSTGSIIQSTREALAELTARGDNGPRRIIVLMVRGEGPCTIGWYALVQSKVLPEVLGAELEAGGHTLELATVGLDGVGDFIRDMGRLGNARKLKGILRYVDAWERGLDRLPAWSRWYLQWGLMRSISRLTGILWPKLLAVESLRAEALRRRAHERQRGSITQAYARGIALLAQSHTRRDIRLKLREARQLLRAVDQDTDPKPRAVIVGEIYVALTSFANRGAIENLMGQQGIEVEEGITLSRFIHHSLQEWKRRSRAHHPLVRPIVECLARYNIHLLGQKPRDPGAIPFMTREVGGEGMVSVGRARHAVENGVQGVLHVFPFKCMPEGLAKDALRELSRVYGVRYLAVSFDRESDVERLKTELATFAVLLKSDLAGAGVTNMQERTNLMRNLSRHRRLLGETINRLHAAVERPRILH